MQQRKNAECTQEIIKLVYLFGFPKRIYTKRAFKGKMRDSNHSICVSLYENSSKIHKVGTKDPADSAGVGGRVYVADVIIVIYTHLREMGVYPLTIHWDIHPEAHSDMIIG